MLEGKFNTKLSNCQAVVGDLVNSCLSRDKRTINSKIIKADIRSSASSMCLKNHSDWLPGLDSNHGLAFNGLKMNLGVLFSGLGKDSAANLSLREIQVGLKA